MNAVSEGIDIVMANRVSSVCPLYGIQVLGNQPVKAALCMSMLASFCAGNGHRCTHRNPKEKLSLFTLCNSRMMLAPSTHSSFSFFFYTKTSFSPFTPPKLAGSKGDVFVKTCKCNSVFWCEVGRKMHGWEWGHTTARQNAGDMTDVPLTRQPLPLQGSSSCFERQMAAAPPHPFIATSRHLTRQKSAAHLAWKLMLLFKKHLSHRGRKNIFVTFSLQLQKFETDLLCHQKAEMSHRYLTSYTCIFK